MLYENPTTVNIIRARFYDEKMSAEYLLQLDKVVEKENKFTKDFSKEKWREYFNLDMEKLDLHSIEIDEILDFAIEFIRDLKL